MRNFPTHFWQILLERKDEGALTRVDETGATTSETYWEWTRRIQRIAVAFRESGLEVGDRVGLIAPNSQAWLDVAFGVWLAGGTLVPIDPDADRPSTLKALGRSGATWIVVQDASEYHRIRGQGATLPEGLDWMLLDWDGESAPGDATTLSQFESEGRSLVARGRVDDLGEQIYDIAQAEPAAVFYDTPLDEDPHGAFYTGRQMATLLEYVGSSLPLGTDAYPAILTSFANPRAFLVAAASLLEGKGLAIGESGEALADHLDSVKPTHLLCGADYLLEKTRKWRRRIEEAPEFMQDEEAEASESGKGAGGFSFGGLLGSIGEQASERLFYRPLRKAFGGKLEVIFVLGEILPGDVEDVLESTDTAVLDIYGMPELAVSHIEQPSNRLPGAVGSPIQGVQCRIDEPDEKGRGEILLKSDALFEDYWDGTGPREKRDGWLATGDRGYVKDGLLYLME
jgi:long-chain acyl-CoA synthetase